MPAGRRRPAPPNLGGSPANAIDGNAGTGSTRGHTRVPASGSSWTWVGNRPSSGWCWIAQTRPTTIRARLRRVRLQQRHRLEQPQPRRYRRRQRAGDHDHARHRGHRTLHAHRADGEQPLLVVEHPRTEPLCLTSSTPSSPLTRILHTPTVVHPRSYKEDGLRQFTSERTGREPFAASHSLLPWYCGVRPTGHQIDKDGREDKFHRRVADRRRRRHPAGHRYQQHRRLEHHHHDPHQHPEGDLHLPRPGYGQHGQVSTPGLDHDQGGQR